MQGKGIGLSKCRLPAERLAFEKTTRPVRKGEKKPVCTAWGEAGPYSCSLWALLSPHVLQAHADMHSVPVCAALFALGPFGESS